MNREVQRLFEAALKVPEERRCAFLESQTSHTAIRREILSLVAHHALAEPNYLTWFIVVSTKSPSCSALN